MDAPTEPRSDRPIDRWFDSYSADHRNPANRRIHVFAVPLILWSVIALLWCIPVPADSGFRAGLWAGLACFAAWMFYFRASRPIGFGMLAVFVAMLWSSFWIERLQGTRFLLWLAVGVFVLAWIAQFVGHSKLYEGKKPSFFTDLRYLLIGPAWVLSKLYRKLGLRW
ncbi:Mpo1-like protein [uncultured Luteimonas sp.]|uniref:Mpo1 family 2-hydroxy fatty acid dioxygenase n=1 Tax=uncultured Luteimonas sp. TaxID=453144 RepID=UPI002629BB68|nr:Mpo1-like protein [uncultured Luteimonas sp.]